MHICLHPIALIQRWAIHARPVSAHTNMATKSLLNYIREKVPTCRRAKRFNCHSASAAPSPVAIQATAFEGQLEALERLAHKAEYLVKDRIGWPRSSSLLERRAAKSIELVRVREQSARLDAAILSAYERSIESVWPT